MGSQCSWVHKYVPNLGCCSMETDDVEAIHWREWWLENVRPWGSRNVQEGTGFPWVMGEVLDVILPKP